MGFERSESTGIAHLLSLVGRDGDALHIHSSRQWPAKRRDIISRLEPLLGEPPETVLPLDAEWDQGENLGAYRRYRVSYQVGPRERCPAWLVVPEPERLRRPGVVCCHQATPVGKDEPAGLVGRRSLFLATELARQGYVCLAPDSITVGERVYPDAPPLDTAGFYAQHPRWSAVGKMLWDHQRGLDFLCAMDQVDQDRLGVIGHGLGGENALMLGAFDHRLKVIAASCAYTPFASDPEPTRWCNDHGFVQLPLLSAHLEQGRHPPFAWVELLALIAPRFLHYTYALEDTVFPSSAAVSEDMLQLGQLYDLLGSRPCLRYHEHPGPHDYPQVARRAAYKLFDNAFS